MKILNPVPLKQVAINDRFWSPRITTNREVTLPLEYELCKKTGRIDAMKLDARRTAPHQFWDSDVAKWVEAAAYSLEVRPDKKLEAKIDYYVDLMAKAQLPDGYLNSFYQTMRPDDRWTDLRDMHELYCAGHLMEAAVAYHHATGKRNMQDVMCRYADHIDRIFGPGKGKKRGYPGHQEIELALVKLYRSTGKERYLKLAEFFVNERGRTPNYFVQEAKKRGETDTRRMSAEAQGYTQAHVPVREQKTATGHAVRAVYLYAGMADIAAETNYTSLLKACRRLWNDITDRQMYVTGGIGSTAAGEKFTFNYDLPNETAYAETCAAIGLVLFGHRMLKLEKDGRYADVMERALYNGIMSGVSLDGTKFFYANPLTVYPEAKKNAHGHIASTRQEWFDCSCCPPNIARLLASLGSYVYGTDRNTLYTHFYISGATETTVSGRTVKLLQQSDYPWDGKIKLTVTPENPGRFTLALRIPAWCRKPSLNVNGKRIALAKIIRKGYAYIDRTWQPGDTVVLDLPMVPERVYAHPSVRMNAGKVALMRGPLVFCLEEKDNSADLASVSLPADAVIKAVKSPQLGGIIVLKTEGMRTKKPAGYVPLYVPDRPQRKAQALTAVPYCLWNNRGDGEMTVWIREE